MKHPIPKPDALALEHIQRRICVWWDTEKLSEGQAAGLLGIDRVAARMLKTKLLQGSSDNAENWRL